MPNRSGKLHAGVAPALLMALLLGLAGCTSVPLSTPSSSERSSARPSESAGATRPGAYYKDDGPGDAPPVDLDRLADAVPRVEPYARGANRPYVIFGREYVPDMSEQTFRQRGMASWYGRKFHGQRTSNGEIYDMYAMTAAHPTLPIPSYVRVTHLGNGRSVILRVNDRGPFLHDRIIDLSYAAAHKLGYARQGSAQVEVERLSRADILAGKYANPGAPMQAAATPLPAAERSVPAAARDEGPVAVAMAVSAPEALTATSLSANSAPSGASAGARMPEANGAGSRVYSAGAGERGSIGASANPASSDGFFLQLGAFRSQAAAENLKTRLVQQFATVAERLFIMPASDWFRVRLGPYSDRAEADSVAHQLRALPGLNPVIVPRL